jgi:hypothetical protein
MWSLFLLAFLSTQASDTVTNLVTFDDLPDLTVIPDGYAQLNWSGFETITSIGDGYTAGLVSSPNVAFNPYGYDAWISSPEPFNLVSASLTSGVVPTMQLEVQGFAGANLAYDNTYTLSETNPTLVSFNYSGVTKVAFFGAVGQPFVMDNLTVSSATFTNIPAPTPPSLPTNTAPGITNVLGFDDLPDLAAIPDGYAGLNWSGFEVLGETDPFFGAGYENGLVSPGQVAFNPFGYNASISSPEPFNLISACLTAAVMEGLRVEVEGFIGTALAYDQSFTLSETSSTFITFNYAGVTRVTFIPEPMSQFVLDNLTVSSPSFTNLPPPATNGPAPNSLAQLGQVEVAGIGHQFFAQFPGFPLGNFVSDYLVDQRQASGGGAVLPAVNVDFDTNNQFALTITAPPGKAFLVHVPDGQSVYFGGQLDWTALPGGSGDDGTTSITFNGLTGTAPAFADQTAALSTMHQFFGFNNIQSLPITSDISFTSVTLTATVPDLNVASGSLLYTPDGDSGLVFTYTTSQTSDPGPFVSLVAAPPQPAHAELLGVGIKMEPNGDVTLTFAGTLQASTNLNDGFTDVPGNPRGRYTIPKASLNASQHFRTRQ